MNYNIIKTSMTYKSTTTYKALMPFLWNSFLIGFFLSDHAVNTIRILFLQKGHQRFKSNVQHNKKYILPFVAQYQRSYAKRQTSFNKKLANYTNQPFLWEIFKEPPIIGRLRCTWYLLVGWTPFWGRFLSLTYISIGALIWYISAYKSFCKMYQRGKN